jgi:hypothetical protein
VIVSRDSESAVRLAELADRILIACIARIGESPDLWEYAGREGVVFAAEADVHRRGLDGWRVAGLPPAVRAAAGPGSAGRPAAGGGLPADLRWGRVVDVADATSDSAATRPGGPAAPWR